MKYLKRILGILLIFSMLFFSACGKTEEQEIKSEYNLITTEEAYQRMNENINAVILDVRTQEEYNAGHISGAILVPNETIKDNKPDKLPDLDEEILIYCRSGNRSQQAAEKLLKIGYTNVYDFGGIQDWTYGIVTGEEEPAKEKKEPSMSWFKTTDLEGNAVTQDIFSEYDLTMINVWGTYCSPCLKEMPDLGNISREYNETGFQIIGISIDMFAADGSFSDDKIKTAKEIIDTTDATYTHLLPSNDLIKAKLREIDVIPYTFFVDSKGEIVGKPYVGSKTEEKWKKIIEEQLEAIKNESNQ
ncbi:rhodanese-like domain-containing protein [Anaerovorax sp. IOR16]|uniref:rhodanese-like domain-containing protein n=1 Tax=Anaerovorax sp. IOR16 TaxID=2773458 RepID=UPI001FD68450|nr:rhodanese-like domain-containing protein [Anaerovorax sp. IOR16]